VGSLAHRLSTVCWCGSDLACVLPVTVARRGSAPLRPVRSATVEEFGIDIRPGSGATRRALITAAEPAGRYTQPDEFRAGK